jgi:hypothetical protein
MRKTFFALCDIGLRASLSSLLFPAISVFSERRRFINLSYTRASAFPLAGDGLTHERLGNVFTQRIGQKLPATFSFIDHLLLLFRTEMKSMFRWFYKHVYNADITELKKDHPGRKDFAAWFETDSRQRICKKIGCSGRDFLTILYSYMGFLFVHSISARIKRTQSACSPMQIHMVVLTPQISHCTFS